MKVAVIGAGKMGLPLACQLASGGAQVTACDVNPLLVDAINQGRMPFEEPGVEALLAAARKSGSLKATTDIGMGVSGCDVVITIVPVLLTAARTADLSVIEQVTRIIAANLAPGMMVVYETTLPAGATRDRLGPVLETSGLRAGVDFDLVFSPERVKSQLVLKNLTRIPKIVGGVNSSSAKRAEEFYSSYLGGPVINLETLEAAELAKLAGMAYRDVNIALSNELAAYAEAVGVDYPAVLQAANTDGEAALLAPGIGVGGHCTPVYPYFLLEDADKRGIDLTLTRSARRINDSQAARFLNGLEDLGVKMDGYELAVLGLAFRPRVKEHICSPAFQLRDEAGRRGARILLHDPLYSSAEMADRGFTPLDPDSAALPETVVLNTAHPEYRNPDFPSWRERGVRYVVDGRNLWKPQPVREAGLIYLGAGL